MKRTLVVVSGILLSLVLFAQLGWAAHTPPRNKAVFSENDACDSGNYLELGVGNYPDLRDYTAGGSHWDNRISCVRIGEGITSVILYEHPDFKGRSKELKKSWGKPYGKWSLAGDWINNTISSVKVIGPGYSETSGGKPPRNKAVFFENDACDSGNYLELGVGNYPDLRDYRAGGSHWDNRISCIKLGEGITSVILYEHPNFEGRSKELRVSWGKPYGKWSLAGDWANNMISSVKVIGPGYTEPSGGKPPRNKAVFYENDACDSEKYLELGVGNYSDLRDYRAGGSHWDNRISCIKLGEGITSVILYEHPNFEGRSKELRVSWGKPYGKWSLAGDWANNMISSVRVIGPGYSEPSGGTPPRNKAVFYQDGECDSGNYIELGKGNYPDLREYRTGLSGSATWDDRISCIKIGEGITRVILYEHPNYEGRSVEFSQIWGGSREGRSLSGDWINDKSSSMKVQ